MSIFIIIIAALRLSFAASGIMNFLELPPDILYCITEYLSLADLCKLERCHSILLQNRDIFQGHWKRHFMEYFSIKRPTDQSDLNWKLIYKSFLRSYRFIKQYYANLKPGEMIFMARTKSVRFLPCEARWYLTNYHKVKQVECEILNIAVETYRENCYNWNKKRVPMGIKMIFSLVIRGVHGVSAQDAIKKIYKEEQDTFDMYIRELQDIFNEVLFPTIT